METATVEALFGQDPESQVLQKDAYNNLSEEAKEVLRLLIHTPEEFFESGYRTWSKESIVFGFLWEKKSQVFGRQHHYNTIREKSVYRDFRMIKEFISLFNGARVWK